MKIPASGLPLTTALGVALTGLGFMHAADLHASEREVLDARRLVNTATGVQPAGTQRYIVTFDEAGVLTYDGALKGYPSTAPMHVAGQRKLNVATSAAQTYSAYLANQRAAHVAAINSVLGRTLNSTHTYAITLNGVAADLSAREAAVVSTVPGIKSVRLAGEQHLLTYRGPTFIGASTIWSGTDTPTGLGTLGQGIVVGDLDGGTNSAHPSFADDASCGFRGAVPKLVAVDCSETDVNGYCHGDDPQATPGFGHGVHTSSTMAGNTISFGASPGPTLPPGVNMSGVAPCAAIHQYKVCDSDSCDGASILAGIQNAIADQVDVLNFSISGGTDPWNDNDRDFLGAVDADIFIAAAAGNLQGTETDPHGKVNHLGPWLMTVAASTQDQFIGPHLKVTGPGTVPPGIATITLTPGSTTIIANTVDRSGLPLLTYPTNLLGCTASGGFPAGYFQDSVAVILRGVCPFAEKITNAYNAGAMTVVIGNNASGSISMDTTGAPPVPAFSIDQSSGDPLIAFIAPLDPPAPPADRIFAAGFETAVVVGDGATGWYRPLISGAIQGDVLAYFSYRGPSASPTIDSTKPDISAPGVNIYAASDIQDGNYAYMSGTSMATPHVTGAAALVRATHPDWSVEEVKSALMMTATNADGVEEDGVTPWITDDVGSGRVDLSKAALAGLTMDETYANFVAANPDATPPGDVRTLNVPELRDMECAAGGCSWTRTVRNRLATSGTWNIATTSAPSFAVTAVPASFTLAPGATQALTFTASRNAIVPAVAFGMVVLTEAGGLAPAQHITVAIRQPPPPNVACSNDVCNLQVDSYTADSTTDAIGTLPVSVFLWLNRFSPQPTDYPITLNSVQTVFGAGNTAIGDTFDVFIYQDTDNDPSNGAILVGSVLGQHVTAPQDSLQTITIPGGLALTGSGDILVALVTRTPSSFPATSDNGLPYEQRSWIGGLSGQTVSTAPDLSTLGMARVDVVLAGFNFNWIIRAQGTNSSGPVTFDVDTKGPN
jgi:subtilisin family serine protease